MNDEQLKERTLAILEDDGLDHLIEPLTRATLTVGAGEEEGAAGRPVLEVTLEAGEEECELLRQQGMTLLDAIWRAALPRPDDPHINLTICGTRQERGEEG